MLNGPTRNITSFLRKLHVRWNKISKIPASWRVTPVLIQWRLPDSDTGYQGSDERRETSIYCSCRVYLRYCS